VDLKEASLKARTIAAIAVWSLLSAQALAQDLVRQVRRLAEEGQVAGARQIVESSRTSPVDLEWLLAASWLARGAGFAKQWDVAEKYAGEVFESSRKLLETRSLDAERNLPTAFGAAIEVIAHAQDAAGDRAAALEFLQDQKEAYRGSSIETRLQKNYLLLSLEGKPFPELAADDYLGPKPKTIAELKGKTVLFFFWAHWCGDCKAQKPILGALHDKYSDEGLVIVGPTQLYGYVARGRDATPQEELDYLRNAYQDSNPIPSWMSVPVSSRNFSAFGVSTTPTLVLVGPDGIVRMYHPGNVSYEELASRIETLLGKPSD
jgi:thiol-disulfide isomerase/thioredoxin